MEQAIQNQSFFLTLQKKQDGIRSKNYFRFKGSHEGER